MFHNIPYANRGSGAAVMGPLSFAFDFVTEHLLEFGTGRTEAIDVVSRTAFSETGDGIDVSLFPRICHRRSERRN